MNKTFRIATWNANGLLQQLAELEHFINTKSIDICLVSESHLTNISYVKMRGYCCYHATHPAKKARGGATIFVKENLKHFPDLSIETEQIQAAAITVELSSSRKLKVASIYCPPRYNLKKEDYAQLITKLGNYFILGGDLNAKNTFWGSRLTTPKGRALFTAGRELNCEFYSGNEPTYWPTDIEKVPDLIDFFVVRGLSTNYIVTESSNSLSSDHTPVIMTISDTVINKERDPFIANNKTNWDLFRQILNEKISLSASIKSNFELEEELENLTQNIQQAAWKSTPEQKSRGKEGILYPLEVRELVKEKRRARKLWHNSRAPGDKATYNRLANELKALIKSNRNESIANYLKKLTALKDTDYSLWKATKGLKRPKLQTPPIRRADNSWARSAKEKAAIFAEHLENTFQPPQRQTDDECTMLIKKNDSLEIQPATLQEIKNEIKNNLSAKKAPGYDLITGQVLKQLPDKGLRKLLHVINAAFRLRYVPRQWKVAEVIMIPKPGKPPNDKSSYRPISLLPTIAKLFEKLFLKRLKPIIEERKLLPSHQFGFREKHSTVEQVHRITNIIEEALEGKKICSSIFLDVAQAFDKVWHYGLKCKLHRDLPLQFYEILGSYIDSRHFRVKQEDEYSDLKTIGAGVPQGSVIGPILYLLYTRDLPEPDRATVATFADDTAILTVNDSIEEATTNLQRSLNKVVKWTRKWRVTLNETKSVHVNFTNQKIHRLPVYINGKQVPHANTAKYLGLTLDVKLRWKEHVKKKKEELNLKYRKMLWLLGRNSELSTCNKLLLYKQILKPIWTYGIQLWGCTKETNRSILQRFQNKVLRGIVNAPWYVKNSTLHRDLKVESVEEEIQRHAGKHHQRLQVHTNSEIQRMIDGPPPTRRLKRTKPVDLL